MFDCDKCIKTKICNNDCCGIIPINKTLYKLVRNKKYKKSKITQILDCPNNPTEIILITDDNICPFLDKEYHRCLIYDLRPKICRDFGVNHNNHPLLKCPYQDELGFLRTPKGSKQLSKEVNNYFKELELKIK